MHFWLFRVAFPRGFLHHAVDDSVALPYLGNGNRFVSVSVCVCTQQILLNSI